MATWLYESVVTPDHTNDKFTISAGHPFLEGQPVRFTAGTALPSGLSSTTTYYVKYVSSTEFQISATRVGTYSNPIAGSVTTFSDNGTGTITVRRYNGFSAGSVIDIPPYIIESLLRDEVFVERDLLTTSASGYDVVIDDLINSTNDYYNNAIIYNPIGTGIGSDALYKITDYVGSSKTLTAEDGSWDANYPVYIKNIRGDYKINMTSFDRIGNTTDGLRRNWDMACSIYQTENVTSLITSLLYESFLIMIKSYDRYKLVAIDEETGTVDTWTNPLKQRGAEMVSGQLTTIDSLFTSFTLKYAYDYPSGKHLKEYYVNAKNASPELTNDSTLKGLCADAEANYFVRNNFEYSSIWIYDDATADKFIDKLVNWHTKQRLIITWAGDFQNYIKYEIGDQIKLNYSKLIPNALNNSAYFMIMGKEIRIQKGSPYVVFTLIEMG